MDLFSRSTSRKGAAHRPSSKKSGSKIPSLTPTAGSRAKAPSYMPSLGAIRLGLRPSRPDIGNSEPKPPPLQLDKPLPSPPAAQIIDPWSPTEVSRTLVDATVAGTPTHEQYPVLRPVEAEPNCAATIEPNPHVEQHAEQGIPPLGAQQNPTLSRNSIPELPTPATDDSPLNRKHIRRQPMITPGPGLHFDDITSAESPSPAKPSRISISKEISSNNRRGELNMQFRFPATSSSSGSRASCGVPRPDIDIVTASIASKEKSIPPRPSAEHSIGSRSTTASSTVASQNDRDVEPGTRVKYLSRRDSEPGMVLTISKDADMLIYGEPHENPEGTAASEGDLNNESQRGISLSALGGRLHRKKAHASLLRRSRPGTAQFLAPVTEAHVPDEGIKSLNEDFLVNRPFHSEERINGRSTVETSLPYHVGEPNDSTICQVVFPSNPPPVPPKDFPTTAREVHSRQTLSEGPTHELGSFTMPTRSFSTVLARPPASDSTTDPRQASIIPRGVEPKVQSKRSLTNIFRRVAKNSDSVAASSVPAQPKRISKIKERGETQTPSSFPDAEAPMRTGCPMLENLLARIQHLPENSAERKRAFEAVDAMFSCIETSKEAKAAADEAELSAQRAKDYSNACQASLQRVLQLTASELESDSVSWPR